MKHSLKPLTRRGKWKRTGKLGPDSWERQIGPFLLWVSKGGPKARPYTITIEVNREEYRIKGSWDSSEKARRMANFALSDILNAMTIGNSKGGIKNDELFTQNSTPIQRVVGPA